MSSLFAAPPLLALSGTAMVAADTIRVAIAENAAPEAPRACAATTSPRAGRPRGTKLVDKVSWMNVATQDGPFDMYVEDLASLFTLDQNTLLSSSTASWNTTRHADPKVDDYYVRYAREMDPAKRKAVAKEFQEFMTDRLYWNTISGSPFYEVAQPWMKDYVYNAEWEVLHKKVWLDR